MERLPEGTDEGALSELDGLAEPEGAVGTASAEEFCAEASATADEIDEGSGWALLNVGTATTIPSPWHSLTRAMDEN